eukprot:TRINITY_DN6944_c0_g3_i1.p2 TRINITY_DN6944_c0_g3~~TRINITY_DN6944_c0_g3_i1.p2  ORF type:complete len:105 (+),score=16.70 TRINITY_DN6944_c0_g3_i1:123-437(+)
MNATCLFLLLKTLQINSKDLYRIHYRRDTDFSQIHRSGVSKILLRGQSYSCNTALELLHLEETWGFLNHTIYLDASCLLYGWNNEYMTYIDYSLTHFGHPTLWR